MYGCMAQWLRTLTSLPGDSDFIPRHACGASQLSVTPFPKGFGALSWTLGSLQTEGAQICMQVKHTPK